jgi:protein-S-isoprenylcysteine O-methyltransferase Ste14
MEDRRTQKAEKSARLTELEKHGESRPHLGPPKAFAWVASLTSLILILVSLAVEHGDNPALRLLGVGMLLLVAFLIFPPFWVLAQRGRQAKGKSYLQTTTVVDQGPYAVIRHPQYLGYILLGVGFALLSQHRVVILLAWIAATCFYLQAIEEERYCLTRLGQDYQDYLQRVPRFNLVLGIVRLLRRNESDGEAGA